MNIKSVCVFCGSSFGRREVYKQAAVELGTLLAERGIRLVYGGAAVGLMGAVADAALAAGGVVAGVIPQALVDKEIAHRGLTELHVVSTMHQRKALMADLADAFVALPGGLGTFEEFFEVATWTQLGIQSKPGALINVDGYYEGLLAQADRAVSEGFLRVEHRASILAAPAPAGALQLVEGWQAPVLGKWIRPESV